MARRYYSVKHIDESQSATDFEYILPLAVDGFPASIEVMREAIHALAENIASEVTKG